MCCFYDCDCDWKCGICGDYSIDEDEDYEDDEESSEECAA